MSMTNCWNCSETMDSDFELESWNGECVCNHCYEELSNEFDLKLYSEVKRGLNDVALPKAENKQEATS